ncbi:MAG: YkgJ family cysteine cluster protein [Bacteroidetes bacterium]|nr:MAG: YkgJ family cysteine cluster protein [Bacteroidota bacterium]
MKYSVHTDSAENRQKVHDIVENAKQLGDEAFTSLVNQGHEEAFKSIDCLSCGNCCSKHSPILLQSDLERIAKGTGLSITQLLTEKVEMDEDGDFIFNQQPCPFLGEDLYCSIYEFRPDACAEFPHSDRKSQSEISDLLEENAFVCPAISQIIKTLENIHPGI